MDSPFCNNNLHGLIHAATTQVPINDSSCSVPITQTNQEDDDNDDQILHSSNTTTNVTNSNTHYTVETSNTDHFFNVPVKSDEYVKCYQHLGTPKIIFPFSCQSFTDLRPEACKFRDRGCILKKWNLASKHVQEKFIKNSTTVQPEQTVFPVPSSKQKNNGLFLADTKLISCSNPECIKIDEDGNEIPTVFHYCCYVNMRASQEFNDLEYNYELDKLGPAQTEIVKKLRNKYNEKQRVILPVCRKACYNKILKSRKKVDNEKISLHTSSTSSSQIQRNRKTNLGKSNGGNLRWDSDSKAGSRTSEEILVHWLTDEENAEKYFGGTHGSHNKVNGTRKDEYHGLLSRIILKENGKIYMYLL